MDLTRIKINLRLKLDKISPKYKPRLQQAFQNFEKIFLEIPFFRSEQFRVLKDGDEEKISLVSGTLGDWLESHFGSICTSEYYKKVATQVITIGMWCLPEYEINSDIVRNRGHFTALAFFMDDVIDGEVVIPSEEFDAIEMQRLVQKGIKLTLKLGYDPEMWKGLCSSGRPFTKSYLNATSDAFSKLKLDEKGMLVFMRILLSGMQGQIWLEDNSAQTCSVNVFRKFRELNCGASISTEMWYGMDYEPIPEHLKRNPTLTIFIGLADRIGGCLNDIFGFMKDVRNGCLDGVIMYRIQGGLDPRAAVQEEAFILVEAVQDYLIVRRTLITDKKELAEYVKMMDTHIYGILQGYTYTDRYGLADFMRVIQDDL